MVWSTSQMCDTNFLLQNKSTIDWLSCSIQLQSFGFFLPAYLTLQKSYLMDTSLLESSLWSSHCARATFLLSGFFPFFFLECNLSDFEEPLASSLSLSSFFNFGQLGLMWLFLWQWWHVMVSCQSSLADLLLFALLFLFCAKAVAWASGTTTCSCQFLYSFSSLNAYTMFMG